MGDGSMKKQLDYPFYEVATEAQQQMARGHSIHQKFTCGRCSSRQTMAEPNKFFIKGLCESCGYETDLEVTGCNYVLVARVARAH